MGPCVSNQLEQVHAPSQNTPGFQPQNNRLDRLSPDNLPNPQYQKNISDPHSQKNIPGEPRIEDVEGLLSAIKKQMQDNKQIYEQFLPISELQKIFNNHQTIYTNEEAFNDTIKMVLEFLAFCKNESGIIKSLETTFTDKFYQELPLKWQKIRQPTFFFNKCQLKVLSYLVKDPKSKVKRYESCFQDLKFDFSQEEADQVAKVTKEMANEDIRSFCFLSGYLLKSCYKMEEEGKSLKEIQQKYMKVIKMLEKNYKPAEEFKGDIKQCQVHKSFNKKELIPKLTINLKQFKTKDEKEQKLNTFIMERAKESMEHFDKFYSLTKEMCYKNDGFGFKAGVKIKNINQKSALLRIKQKMLTNIYEEKKLEQSMKHSKTHSQSKVQGINDFVKKELNAYEERMEEIFQSHEEPIQFKVSDMLRGKCMFIEAAKINKCCSDIIEAVSKDETLKLMEVDNRLAKPTSDITLKILFGNVIAQLQLGMDRKVADYEFSHKIYELVRSKFFTPLCQLSILNQSLSKDYFSEVSKMVEANTKSSQNFEETVIFSEVGEGLIWFKDFLKNTNIEIESNSTIQADKILVKQSAMKLQYIVQSQLKKIDKKTEMQINLSFGRYLYKMHRYQQAIVEVKKGLENCSKETSEKGQTIEADLNYLGGQVYYSQGNYSEAIKYYQRCLQIQEKVKGKGSISTALTLNNIGGVYYGQGNYSEAIKYYQRCLQIQEKVKGKGSIDTASTLNNIGMVYKDQGNYSEAIKYYEQCLQIKEKVKGKGSIDTALTLNNIGMVYSDQGNYKLSLEYLLKSTNVYHSLKVKSPPLFQTLKNLGNSYIHLNEFQKANQSYKQSVEGYISIKQTDKAKNVFEKLANNMKKMGLDNETKELRNKYELWQ